MYKRHIVHLLSVSMKYFFDFDDAFFSHFFIIAVIATGLVKLLCSRVTTEFLDGLLTLKDDVATINYYSRRVFTNALEKGAGLCEQINFKELIPLGTRFFRK